MKEKQFEQWISVKSDLHNSGIFRDIKEGEVWWCSMGVNVGVEMVCKIRFQKQEAICCFSTGQSAKCISFA